MSPGVDDGSGPLPLENEQQATSSIAGLQGSVAEAQEAVRELQTEKKAKETKKEMLSDHIVILNRCLRLNTFTRDGFTIDTLGEVADRFDHARPSEDAIRAVITELKEKSIDEDGLAKLEDSLKVSPLFFAVSIHLTFELSHCMWLYCLCGGGNFGPFGGTASDLLAFPHHLYFIFPAMTHLQHVCVGVAKSAVEMHSFVFILLFRVVVHYFAHTLTES